MAAGDIRYPLQLDVVRNGLPDSKLTITDLQVNPPLANDVFAIPEEVMAVFKAHPPVSLDDRPLSVQNAQEIAKDVILLAGFWNTTTVKQTDGIVVVEAPIGSGYSAKVLAEAQRRYPGVPLKAVISTSRAWPHIGGSPRVRCPRSAGLRAGSLLATFAAPGCGAAAGVSGHLGTFSAAGKFVSVTAQIVIGTGPNRVEIYPLRGDETERRIMVYFPDPKLLYASDAFQKVGDSYIYPETVSGFCDAVMREHLDVKDFS